jgi:transcriptional regulator with XRE-family HTH domain
MAEAEAGSPPSLSARIREARKAIPGLSQEKAARRLHLSLGAYAAYERGQTIPSPERAREIAVAFGLPEDYFAEGVSEEAATTVLTRLLAAVERLERAVARLDGRPLAE